MCHSLIYIYIYIYDFTLSIFLFSRCRRNDILWKTLDADIKKEKTNCEQGSRNALIATNVWTSVLPVTIYESDTKLLQMKSYLTSAPVNCSADKAQTWILHHGCFFRKTSLHGKRRYMDKRERGTAYSEASFLSLDTLLSMRFTFLTGYFPAKKNLWLAV
jgi:hypothetical protein